jgi:hypothetical protein
MDAFSWPALAGIHLAGQEHVDVIVDSECSNRYSELFLCYLQDGAEEDEEEDVVSEEDDVSDEELPRVRLTDGGLDVEQCERCGRMAVTLLRVHNRVLKLEAELTDGRQRAILAEEGVRVKNRVIRSLTQELDAMNITMADQSRHETRAEWLATTLLEDPWANVSMLGTFTAGNIMDKLAKRSLEQDTRVPQIAFEIWKFGDEETLDSTVLEAPVTVWFHWAALAPMELTAVKKHQMKQTTKTATAKSTTLAHAAKVTHRVHPALVALQDNITKFKTEVKTNLKKALQGLFQEAVG